MIDDLKIIKKYYGEDMMKYCRASFPTILEVNGLLSKILTENFYTNHSLYEDLVATGTFGGFKNYIFSKTIVEEKSKSDQIPTPRELLNNAGYDLYECKTEEEIQKFKNYYANSEQLCTFNGGRLDDCYVFFAVKKNISEIKRSDFSEPNRQDKYGTSIISIQFTKDEGHTLSIKNRYNHSVANPDATFSNNLDNIIEGLTDSFAQAGYEQKYKSTFEIIGYVRANDGYYYKYNYQINNIYYCPNNIMVENFKAKQFDKSRHLLIDYFVIDLVNKALVLYNDLIIDSFSESVNRHIKKMIRQFGKENFKIEIKNNEAGKKITLFSKDQEEIIEISVDKNNKIISVYDNVTEIVRDNYLSHNSSLKTLKMTSLEKACCDFLDKNIILESFEADKLKEVELNFLYSNQNLKILKLPSLEKVMFYFLENNRNLEVFEAPLLNEIPENLKELLGKSK